MKKSQEIVDKTKTACNILHEVATMVENTIPHVAQAANTISSHCKEIASKAKTLKGQDK
jgi:hypothetical protein